MNALKSVLAFTLLSLFAFNAFSQDEKWDDTIKLDTKAEVVLAAISSTGAGGAWSSPATWAGGVVPGAGDSVTIVGGSTVLIDMDVAVASLTVGNGSPGTSTLSFDPVADRTLTINGDLTLTNSLSVVTSPVGGVLTGSTLTIGGNVVNNGVLDLSTNSNQSGAGLKFTGATNNTFSGTGSTDIRTITIDKGAIANTLELTSSNFTVQGSTTDTAASGYLTLVNGTFKLSGTFTGNHRTFPAPSYSIPAAAGFWLNNPNYTVTAQTGDVLVAGHLQISDGVYNVGTTATNMLGVVSTGLSTGGLITVNSGTVNVSGAMRRTNYTNVAYKQFGGTVTTCMAGNFAPCFDLSSQGGGGKLVIQTPAAVPNDANPDYAGGPTWSTYLTFGNANTPSGPGIFTASTGGVLIPAEVSLAIDTTAGAHTVRISRGANAVNLNDLNIGPGGTLDLLDNDRLYLVGDSYINNGTIKTSPTIDFRVTASLTGVLAGPADFSGSGSFFGPVGQIAVFRRNLVLGAGMNLRTGFVYVQEATIINANRITLGYNNSTASTISLAKDGFIDSAPTFDLGTGGQQLVYSGIETSRTMGPELNPARSLAGLSVASSTAGSVLNVTGGDLTVNGSIAYVNIINMGSNKLRHLSGAITPCVGTARYVRGGMVRRFSTATENYTFPVGISRCMAAKVTATELPSGSADVELTGNAGALSGMPANSVPFTWNLQQTGAMTSRLELLYGDPAWPGNEFEYRAYKSSGGGSPQVMIMGSSVNTSTDTITIPSVTDLTASWGVGVRPPRVFVNISGTVYGPNGAPLRNAIVRLQGGEMQTPKLVYTGSLGTYAFEGVIGPELEYTVTASAKRYRFANASVTITPSANVTGLDFIANPPSKTESGLK